MLPGRQPGQVPGLLLLAAGQDDPLRHTRLVQRQRGERAPRARRTRSLHTRGPPGAGSPKKYMGSCWAAREPPHGDRPGGPPQLWGGTRAPWQLLHCSAGWPEPPRSLRRAKPPKDRAVGRGPALRCSKSSGGQAPTARRIRPGPEGANQGGRDQAQAGSREALTLTGAWRDSDGEEAVSPKETKGASCAVPPRAPLTHTLTLRPMAW